VEPQLLTPRTTLGVIGAGGRLGGRVVAAAGDGGVPVVLRGGRTGWAGDVPAVIIDASVAAALPDVLAYCGKHGVPLLSATSGLTAADRDALAELARGLPVLRAENLSLGHHLQCRLAAVLRPFAARGEVRIVDRHPAYKVDRPSATALALRAVLGGAADAGIDSVRAGMPVCEHDVRLAFGEEELVVRHAVRDWAAYARNAVNAALWLARRTRPGLYGMSDFFDADAGAAGTQQPTQAREPANSGTRTGGHAGGGGWAGAGQIGTLRAGEDPP
jgi:4-hydroxy-tetrahydrodipicolinate reductase